jgi:hypothetical protein
MEVFAKALGRLAARPRRWAGFYSGSILPTASSVASSSSCAQRTNPLLEDRLWNGAHLEREGDRVLWESAITGVNERSARKVGSFEVRRERHHED